MLIPYVGQFYQSKLNTAGRCPRLLKRRGFLDGEILSKINAPSRGNDQQQFILEFTETCFVRFVHQGEQARHQQ